MANILDGTALSKEIRSEVAESTLNLKTLHNLTPGLAAVLVGDDPASAVYVRNKGRACDEVGIFSEVFRLPKDTTQESVLDLVEDLNRDDRFHGILVQLPLPEQIDETTIIEHIAPSKDVDGIHPFNLGKLTQGIPEFIPGTPAGVQQLLVRNGYDPAGKHVVICGRSNIVGKPLATLLTQRSDGSNATVTVCHTRTNNITDFTKRADIVVAAIGRPKAITADMLKPGCIVIDVGINRVEDASRKSGYRLIGDVDYENILPICEAITPVPGGVGPMTIAMLLVNTVKAAEKSIK
ncbi:MAG: bifunctional methylenetetrahydrofolate dehydrogenase/methenyltetrahydrofolate cyclohydrolase FolD [SAR202 cluster bacterium]|jgi:methylenetetrahydrofolate dehydrogenase (NADP+)/methenyltetrahydrofolate cyclohydrolase|nr:bifunctional methylenetetrahydrofolate dehydrogenase/methenyltetrahydrofolate cyclohydrolase FolD [Dehalococcoidia bacterium]MQG81419.1 bifunctional methylenetetrahydrofolate dehydrogenase/methenyltetrahydrofolate cyclohydrolase FolD [SAR202 cluster bacterium]